MFDLALHFSSLLGLLLHIIFGVIHIFSLGRLSNAFFGGECGYHYWGLQGTEKKLGFRIG
jgi:hypothetical protein